MNHKNIARLLAGVAICGCCLGLSGVTYADVVRTEKGNIVMENVPEVPGNIVDRMQQYLSTRSATVCDWIPGESGLLMFTRFGETTQLHKVQVPGAYRQQLTFFSEPINGAAVNPNPQYHSIILLKDVGGNENYQLFHFDRDTGVSKMISDGKSRYGQVVWSHDGKRIAYQSTQRNGKDWDIWVADPLHPEDASIVYRGEGHWSVLDWSADGEYMLVHKYVSIVDSRLELLEVASGKTQRLGCAPDSQEKFSIEDARFSSNGEEVYFISDRGQQFGNLYRQSLASGKIKALATDTSWGIESFCVDPHGDYLAFVCNENGVSVPYLLELETGDYEPVSALPRGVVTGMVFEPNGRHLAVSINSSRSPGDVYTVDVDGEDLKRWTYSEIGGLDESNLVEPVEIHYPTFDKVNGERRLIPAYLYLPEKVPSSGKVPVLINIHGGPESQFQPYFSSLTQYLVCELGIAVIAPNVRGSSGYGSDYVQLDNGYLRQDSVKDIGSLLDYIKDNASLDENRVAVMGGSYGGFMTLASLCMYNDRLCAGVDNVGISNFVTFLKNTKDYRRDLRRAEYGDERDPKMCKFLNDIAPSNNAHKITKPLYVVQGANDPRVPLSEAEQIVREVRSNGGDVWYMVAKDEGHGFRKKVNRDLYLETVVMFLQKHLLGK